MADTIVSVFEPLPPQEAFIRSNAFIRGYGGAMRSGEAKVELVAKSALMQP